VGSACCVVMVMFVSGGDLVLPQFERFPSLYAPPARRWPGDGRRDALKGVFGSVEFDYDEKLMIAREGGECSDLSLRRSRMLKVSVCILGYRQFMHLIITWISYRIGSVSSV
jgi:hypothetical protein